jgi:hypothetical protein
MEYPPIINSADKFTRIFIQAPERCPGSYLLLARLADLFSGLSAWHLQALI